MTGARVLGIDTSGPVIGVALAADGRSWRRTERVRRGAEARLVPWAQALCAEARLTLRDLDGLAVVHGPGAFTGLRVGLATALGLAMGLGVPLWTTSSLAVRAARLDTRAPVLVALDARKGRVYAAVYADDVAVRPPADVDPAEAASWLDGETLATGEGVLVHRELFEAAGAVVADGADDPATEVLAQRGGLAIARGAGVPPEQVRPLYLREPDATPPADLRERA